MMTKCGKGQKYIRQFIALLGFYFILVHCEPNHKPILAEIPDKVAKIKEKLIIELDATDPDGDALAYTCEFDVPPASKNYQTDGSTFIWTPAYKDGGKEYNLTCFADDGDASDTQVAHIVVSFSIGPDSTAPRFLSPPEEEPAIIWERTQATDKHFQMNVEIRDEDSTDVVFTFECQAEAGLCNTIQIKSAITQTCPMCYILHGLPSDAQANMNGKGFIITLIADDHDNTPQKKRCTIRIF